MLFSFPVGFNCLEFILNGIFFAHMSINREEAAGTIQKLQHLPHQQHNAATPETVLLQQLFSQRQQQYQMF